MQPYAEYKSNKYPDKCQNACFAINICGSLGIMEAENAQGRKLAAALADIDIGEIIHNYDREQSCRKDKYENNVVYLFYSI